MRVLFAAKAGFDYNRTFILIKGLRAIGHEVIEHQIPDRNPKCGRELFSISQSVDFVVVPPFRHRDLSFVRKYAQAPVVFDPLISRYLTKVVDYNHWWKAPQKWWIDYRDFRNCDLLIADTQAHLDYFRKTFKLPSSLAQAVIPVGVDTGSYQPTLREANKRFQVGFYGTFVPLQGVRALIEAAALLKDNDQIEFQFFGTGHQFKDMQALAKKRGLDPSIFKGWIPYEELPQCLAQLDLALGIFGDSSKSDKVVPNKLFHYAALGIPCLTKDSTALREVFEPGADIICSSTEPKAIALHIEALSQDSEKLSGIAHQAKAKIHQNYSHKALAEKLVDTVKDLVLV